MEDVAVLASAEAVTDVGSGRCLTTDGSSATGGSADPAGDSSSASDGLAAGTFACDCCGKAHGGLAALVAHWRSQHMKDGTSEPLFDHAKPVFAGHVAFCQQCGDGPFCCNRGGFARCTAQEVQPGAAGYSDGSKSWWTRAAPGQPAGQSCWGRLPSGWPTPGGAFTAGRSGWRCVR